MKIVKLLNKTAVLALLAIATVSSTANAQLGDAGEILKAGASDANKLMQAYLNPFGKGFGAAMNTGWFTSAAPHKTLGFDLSVSAGVAIVPSGDLKFNVNDLGLTTLELKSGTSAETGTLSGDKNTDTVFEIYADDPSNPGNEILLTSFDMPGGVGIGYVPSPVIQASVGIIKDTDISLRFAPETEIGDFGSIGMFGFGIKHGLNQWIPGGGLLPVDLSVQFGYSSLKMDGNFDVTPDVDGQTYNPFPASTWEGQGVAFEATGYTFNVIAGKKLPVIGGYVGVGYESSTTTVGTPGSYPITSINPNYDPSSTAESTREKIIEKIDEPLDLEFTGDNSFRAFAGVEIKLFVLKIFANYTLSTYSAVNAGVGISFR